MVDQSLLRQAADLGVTICFADLDGAEGLWVPEERTILVSRGLSDVKVAEVIKHELAHVMIDDQHADLDAGKDVLVGRPPARHRRALTVALAAVGLVVVIGGAMYGVSAARDGRNQVAPNPDGPGLTVPDESGSPRPSLSPSLAPDGGIVYVTVYPTAPTRSSTGSPLGLPSLSPSVTRPAPTPSTPRTTGAPPPRQQTTTSPPPPPPSDTSEPTPQIPPTTDPPSVVPSPEDSGAAGDGTGDVGGIGDGTDSGPVGTDPPNATLADVSVPPAPDGTAAP